jgi:hypothetical protein
MKYIAIRSIKDMYRVPRSELTLSVLRMKYLGSEVLIFVVWIYFWFEKISEGNISSHTAYLIRNTHGFLLKEILRPTENLRWSSL